MFTVKATEKKVMYMMNQEMSMGNMCMCMSMFCCASMYQNLPETAEFHLQEIQMSGCKYTVSITDTDSLHEQEESNGLPAFFM